MVRYDAVVGIGEKHQRDFLFLLLTFCPVCIHRILPPPDIKLNGYLGHFPLLLIMLPGNIVSA